MADHRMWTCGVWSVEVADVYDSLIPFFGFDPGSGDQGEAEIISLALASDVPNIGVLI